MKIPQVDVVWTDGVEWDALPVRVFFKAHPNEESITALDDLAVGLHRLGVAGGFGGVVHDADLRGACLIDGEWAYEAVLDLGSADRLALEVLERALRSVSETIGASRIEADWRAGE